MKRLKTINEISHEFGVSKTILYSQIKTDPTFPVVNIGRKKKYMIDTTSYLAWLAKQTIRPVKFTGEELVRRFRK